MRGLWRGSRSGAPTKVRGQGEAGSEVTDLVMPLLQTQAPPQGSVSAPLYNTMMISQPGQPNLLQISTSLPQTNAPQGATVTTFTQDRQIR